LISSSSYELSSSQFDVLTKAKSLRRKTWQIHIEAREASEQSQYGYQHGSKSKADMLSIEKNYLYEQMQTENCLAAKLFFEHYNEGCLENVIDLYGLYVQEALKYLEKRLHDCRSKSMPRLTAITGKGNNSSQNIAKIKPAVENFALDIQLERDVYNGHIVLDLRTEDQTVVDVLFRENNYLTHFCFRVY